MGNGHGMVEADIRIDVSRYEESKLEARIIYKMNFESSITEIWKPGTKDGFLCSSTTEANNYGGR